MQPKITPVFSRISRAYRQGHNLIILQGGQGSSKTHSALDFFYTVADRSPERLIFSVVSYALPHLKLGVVREMESIIASYGHDPDEYHNKSDHYFRIGNSIIDYFGVRDNYSKVTGPRRHFLFINEANNKITYDDFDQMNQRTHICTILDFNPRSEFWVHEKIIPNFEHYFDISTYLDNPFLPKSEYDKIIWKKGKDQFKNWWTVYGEGKIGKMEDTIFPNWDYGKFPEDLPVRYGLDFGFHPSPDAFIKVAIDKRNMIIYAGECFYSTGLTPSGLENAIGVHAKNNDRIIADSADQRMIFTLRKKYNISGVKKKGTIAEWIRLMQDYKIIVCEDSPNLERELNNYLWVDQKAGIPIDDFNHLIDGIRYCFMDETQTRIPTKVY